MKQYRSELNPDCNCPLCRNRRADAEGQETASTLLLLEAVAQLRVREIAPILVQRIESHLDRTGA